MSNAGQKSPEWKTVATTNQEEALILKGLLEENQIPVKMKHEAIGTLCGLTVGPLAEVALLVPAQDLARALELIQSTRDSDEE